MLDEIVKQGKHLGFEMIYFLPPANLSDWRSKADALSVAAHVISDMPSAFPKASTMLLLVYPYHPHGLTERVGAYYLASTRAYHASKALADFITQIGYYAEPAFVPVRAFALENGIGAYGRNGLLRIDPFGSRIALYAIASDIPLPNMAETSASAQCGKNCTACIKACPTGAITFDGLNRHQCMRYHMNTAEHPEEVRLKQQTFIGCEKCMFACPLNNKIKSAEPDEAALDAFELKRLILGDSADARKLVGRNMSANGKLSAEAIVFAAREGLHEDEIRLALLAEHEAVRNVAAWAIANFFNKQQAEVTNQE